MTRQSRFGIALGVCVSAITLTGCLKAVGGGNLTTADGGLITTGFQMRCSDIGTSGHVTGQFQYHDHELNVAFHADIDQLLSMPCEEADRLLALPPIPIPGTFQASGTYTPQPPNLGPGGLVQVTIQSGPNDFSFAGCDLGADALVVQLSGDGVYGTYNEQGCLEKGNFTVFTDD
jgi:hypothetical protein